MDKLNVFRNTKTKAVIYVLGFILLIAGYFFILNFYSKRIINKIQEINSLKEKIRQANENLERENQFKKLKASIEQKAGKDLPSILFGLQQKLDRDFEKTKDLILNKLKEANWQTVKTNFNPQEKKLGFFLEIPDVDLSKFYNFIIEDGLVWDIADLKINKKDNMWQIELNLQK
jgi:Rad3-related DNA helicase